MALRLSQPTGRVVLDDANSRQIERWLGEIGTGRRSGANPFGRWMTVIGHVYAENMNERHLRLSRGGSWRGVSWKPLSRATITARRHRSGKKSRTSNAVLIDTGQLHRSSNLNSGGSELKDIKGGVRFQFRRVRHTGRTNSGGATVGGLAAKHHLGDPGRRLPARLVLDAPDIAGIRKMISAARKIASNMRNQLGGDG